MYVPAHFRPSDPDAPWGVIARHGFGTLVTVQAGTPLASPLPFLARPQDSMLVAHLARANPQYRHLHAAPSQPALVIFQGPSGFVSGAYYRDPAAIPTWDHVTVHVTGRVRLIQGEPATLRVLEETVAHFEQQAGSEWRLDLERPDLPAFVRQVAAFTVAVDRVDASFKLSQNVDAQQRQRVAEGLSADGHRDLVAAIEAENDRRPEPAQMR